MRLTTLLAALEQPARPDLSDESALAQIDITNIAYDSRSMEPGGLFIAIPGAHTDGRAYLEDAARLGARAAIGPPLREVGRDESALPFPYIEVRDVLAAHADLASAFYGTPARQLCTIGVTGTDGKTTTSNLIHALFSEAGLCCGLMTTANFKIGDQEWENNTRQSTLEALDVQRLLRRMLSEGVTHAIVEATSHGLELSRVRGCAFDIGVVTNITHEHLDFHKTLENYRRAKARLFEMLDPRRDKGLGVRSVAILNRDDSSFEVLKPYCRVPILDYGVDTEAAIRAVDVQLDANGTRFRLLLPDGEARIETQLVGPFNVSNCLAAIAAAYSQGIAPDIIARTLKKAHGVTGRMERVDEGQPFTVIVDYAHTPDSLAKVLAVLRPLTTGKLMVVFGSAGERDVQKRPIMGRIAAQMTDFFVITDEDPREEDREVILREIARGSETEGKREGRDFLCIADRRQAIMTACARAEAGDTILLAGKGHEQSIIIGREKIPWDERRVAREALREVCTS